MAISSSARRQPIPEQSPISEVPSPRYDSPPAWIALLGRICFSLIFIFASFSNFTAATIAAGAAKGVPYPGFSVPLAGALALFGGISVLFGYRTRFGASLLILFLVPVTLMMHNFWSIPGAAEASLQKVMFLKNLSMLGGAFMIAYFGGGPLSLDYRRSRIYL